MTGFAQKLGFALSEIEWRALGFGSGTCPLCGGHFFLRISRDLLGTRCLRCGASPISMAIGAVVGTRVPDFEDRRVCEFSSRGPFFDHLARRIESEGGELCHSEYFDEVPPGERRKGVQCQDIQNLTYTDESFDLCTSTEVFEHVPDDGLGFREVLRVLARGGWFVFTVPLYDRDETVERATFAAGEVQHLLSPTYHDDFIRGSGRVLVYRDYGRDITKRLTEAGFEDPKINEIPDPAGLGAVASVVTARKPDR